MKSDIEYAQRDFCVFFAKLTEDLTKSTNNYNVVHMNPTPSLGEFEQLVLLSILRLADTAYGVSIRQELESCARRTVSPGALYTTLERLEQKRLVVARQGASTPERGGRAKRFYLVTDQGKSQLAEAQRTFQRLMAGLDLLGETNG